MALHPLRLLRAAALAPAILLVVACAAPGRAEIGGLRLENRLDRAVAVAARWQDEAEGTYHVFEAVLPPQGSDMWARLDEELPSGTRLQFASRGEGFAAVCRRQGMEITALLGGVGATVDGMHWVGLHRTSGSQPQEGGEMADAEAEWTYPGGAAVVVVERAADGTLVLRARR